MSTLLRRLPRRTVLRGVGGAAIALPWLEAMGLPRARAAGLASGFPKRFIAWFTPNGNLREQWAPSGGETSFALSRILRPLEPFKDHLVVLDGLDNEAGKHGPGDQHQKGMGTLLSGTECVGNGSIARASGGITLDQQLVKSLQPKTKLPSLELAIEGGSPVNIFTTMSYLGADRPLPAERRPDRAFARLFGGGGGSGPSVDSATLARLATERRSILDAAARSYAGLAPRLHGADRAKVDAHLTELRSLEKRLNEVSASRGCGKPAAPAAPSGIPGIGRAQMDVLAAGLACDLTRIGTLQWTDGVAPNRYSFLGYQRSHHDMSHDPDSAADTKEGLAKINIWLGEQFAYLLGKLKSIPEGNGTLLDNTLILQVNELARGNLHSMNGMPYLLAGRAGGALRTGRFLKYKYGTSNNLFVSVLHAFDVPVKTFGNPAYCTGALAGL
jgi:hypothetical protein